MKKEIKLTKNKILIITVSVFTLLMIGISYAFFTYNRTGTNQQMVMGDIYMHYGETNQLDLEGVFPSATYNPDKYFEFIIKGKNTFTKEDI